MKKILFLLSLVFVFSIGCEDDIVETPQKIEVKEVGGETVNFDDIDTYELGDLVDLQIDIVLPAGSKVAANDFEVNTFVSDQAQVVNSEAGYVVMAENAGGETMLLGYALPPAEVKKSLSTKSALIKSKATYNNSEISCRSTMLSLVMMSLGKLEGVPSANAMEKVLAHAEFHQLVAKFTDRFNNDPIFLEKINEDKEIKNQIKKIAKDVLSQCITEIVNANKNKSTTKSTGVLDDFWWPSDWRTNAPWNWHGEANYINVWDAPFLAICEKSNVPLKEKLAIANPANINFIADFYDESGKFQDWRFIGRNSTLIQKVLHSGASQTTVLTDVDFIDGFNQNKTYKVVIKKCLGKNFDELRYNIVRGAHLLRVGESVMNIVADGELFNLATTAMTNKAIAIDLAKSLSGIINSINLADLSSPGNVTSIFETAVVMLGNKAISQYLSSKAVELAGKASVKIAGKASNPAGWAVMIFDAVNDFIPMSVSMATTPEKVEYTFNLAQNKIYDNNAPSISIANLSPNNGQEKVDNPVTFTWNGSAEKYQLLMWATDDPSDIIHFPKSADKTQTVKNLNFGKKYKWQVTAYSEDGYSVKGDVWEFTMANGENQKPTKPVAMYPLGLEDNIPTSMRFEWTKSTDPNPDDLIQYKLTYFYEKNGEVAEKFEKIIEETYFDAKLKAGQTYYWNVVAIDDRGTEALGNSYAFTTIPNTAPSKPVLISPTDNSTDINTTVEFSWNACSDVDEDNITYEITVQTGDEVKLATSQNTNYSYTLEANTSYTWYVEANDNNGGKIKSEVWAFTTKEISNERNCLITSNKSGTYNIWSANYNGTSISPLTKLTNLEAPYNVGNFKVDELNKRIVYSYYETGKRIRRLRIIDFDGNLIKEITNLPAGGGASDSFDISPNGDEIIFAKGLEDQGLNMQEGWVVGIDNTNLRKIITSTAVRGTTTHKTTFKWFHDKIVFSNTRVWSDWSGQHDIHILDLNTNTYSAWKGNTSSGDYYPIWNSDNTKVFMRTLKPDVIKIINWETGSVVRTVIPTSGSTPRQWIDDNHLIYSQAGDVFSVSIDGTNITNLTNSIEKEAVFYYLK